MHSIANIDCVQTGGLRNFLSLMRTQFTPNILEIIAVKAVAPPQDILCLFVTNRECENYSAQCLREIPGEYFNFPPVDFAGDFGTQALVKTGLAKNPSIKMVIPVMFVENIDVSNG